MDYSEEISLSLAEARAFMIDETIRWVERGHAAEAFAFMLYDAAMAGGPKGPSFDPAVGPSPAIDAPWVRLPSGGVVGAMPLTVLAKMLADTAQGGSQRFIEHRIQQELKATPPHHAVTVLWYRGDPDNPGHSTAVKTVRVVIRMAKPGQDKP